MFTGRSATLLVEGAPEAATVTGVSAAGLTSYTVQPKRVDFPIAALWARERIAALGKPTLFVMEGGYAVEEIGINAVNVLEGFEHV